MATENEPGTPDDSTTTPPEGTPGTGKQDDSKATPETGGNGQPKSGNEEPVKLPDDHPLVKSLEARKTELSTLKTELAEARSNSSKASKLQEELDKRPTQDALDTLQTRYDRLEAFAQATGLGSALDSRTFTKRLFESEDDVASIVKDWNKANPSATSKALGSKSSEPGSGKVDPNELLRAAFNGGNK